VVIRLDPIYRYNSRSPGAALARLGADNYGVFEESQLERLTTKVERLSTKSTTWDLEDSLTEELLSSAVPNYGS
jgi:hypothetical protein